MCFNEFIEYKKTNMNWNEALLSLKTTIGLDLHLTPEKNFKFIREIPPYKCKNYNNSEDFKVQVGERSFVNIPLEILETIFEAAKLNNNTCNRAVFKSNLPRELNAKPCNLHSVGKLFEHAGVMEMIDAQNYKIVS
jgi:hypothetical protein